MTNNSHIRVSGEFLYDPFGMMLSGRNWDAGSGYRYGFNGAECDDEIYGNNNSYSFEFRVLDPRLGKFLSVDPLRDTYPHNSPYLFAENRVIDGIDLEGGEYITYTIRVYGANTGAIIFDVHDYRDNADFDYVKYSESFGGEGRGIKYIYEYVNEADEVIKTEVMWEMRQSDLASNLGNHGLFMGSGSITQVGPLFNPNTTANDYNFAEFPIDGVDEVAYYHDMAASEISDYQGWLEDSRTIYSDKELISGFDNYLKDHTLVFGRKHYKPKGNLNDPITGRPASEEALVSASTGSIFFNVVVNYKEWKIQQLNSMGADPFAVESQNLISLEDYKIDMSQFKWHEFGKKSRAIARNAEYEILKAASDETSK